MSWKKWDFRLGVVWGGAWFQLADALVTLVTLGAVAPRMELTWYLAASRWWEETHGESVAGQQNTRSYFVQRPVFQVQEVEAAVPDEAPGDALRVRFVPAEREGVRNWVPRAEALLAEAGRRRFTALRGVEAGAAVGEGEVR